MIEKIEIKITDDNYPEMLRSLAKPPVKLYAMGNVELLKEESIAVVGTRHITDYGIRHGKEICREFAKRSITIISGMAKGTDTLAHKTALEFGGKTIAVIPCGFNDIFPKQNKKLFNEIIQNGGLAITEYEENIKADSNKFLERNRIVAGLARCLFVVEALFRSGTSVTAKMAMEQGKTVFALPGSVDSSYSVGTNNLIKSGAKIATNAVDILENYPQFVNRKVKEKEVRKIDEEYQKIFFNIFSDKFLSVDEIIRKTGMPTREVITKLTLMEIEGIIEQELGKGFRKKV